MFWLNWDFALVAVGVTPFLLLFVARFKKAVKKAQHQVRLHQADIVDRRAAGPGVGARGQGVRPAGSGGDRGSRKSARPPSTPRSRRAG